MLIHVVSAIAIAAIAIGALARIIRLNEELRQAICKRDAYGIDLVKANNQIIVLRGSLGIANQLIAEQMDELACNRRSNAVMRADLSKVVDVLPRV